MERWRRSSVYGFSYTGGCFVDWVKKVLLLIHTLSRVKLKINFIRVFWKFSETALDEAAYLFFETMRTPMNFYPVICLRHTSTYTNFPISNQDEIALPKWVQLSL